MRDRSQSKKMRLHHRRRWFSLHQSSKKFLASVQLKLRKQGSLRGGGALSKSSPSNQCSCTVKRPPGGTFLKAFTSSVPGASDKQLRVKAATTQHRKWQQCESTSSQPYLVLCNCPDWVKLLGRLRHHFLANRGLFIIPCRCPPAPYTSEQNVFLLICPLFFLEGLQDSTAKGSFEESGTGRSTMTSARGCYTIPPPKPDLTLVRQSRGAEKPRSHPQFTDSCETNPV